MKIKSQKFGTFDFPEEYDVIRVATLNKTDLKGGNNKYYQCEAHVSKDRKKYRLYSRYGRVGHTGKEEERIPDQTEAALLKAFESLKKEKTSKRKGYVEVKMASTKIGSSVNNERILSDDIKKDKIIEEEDEKKSANVEKLHSSVERLVARLYEEAGQAVRRQLSGSLQTTAENPLGTLTLTQIEDGRKILQEIQKLLTKKPNLKHGKSTRLLDLSNQFYSAIPQVMKKRPTKKQGAKKMDEWLLDLCLNNEEKLDDKEELLDLLGDVQGISKGFATTDIGQKYLEIGCEYEFVAKDDKPYKKITDFINKTRSRHHGWGADIRNIWRMRVKGQKESHVTKMKSVGNIKPLFHGSRNANILGICKHGLLMRPPGVYITGSMFGNGLYFANQSSKSEQYSTSRFGGGSRRAETFFLLVADVALGKIKKYQTAQTHLRKPPAGYNSVQGAKGYSLLHDEFIIYDVKQHILQYLIEFRPRGRY